MKRRGFEVNNVVWAFFVVHCIIFPGRKELNNHLHFYDWGIVKYIITFF